jgi:hypothetical protein
LIGRFLDPGRIGPVSAPVSDAPAHSAPPSSRWRPTEDAADPPPEPAISHRLDQEVSDHGEVADQTAAGERRAEPSEVGPSPEPPEKDQAASAEASQRWLAGGSPALTVAEASEPAASPNRWAPGGVAPSEPKSMEYEGRRAHAVRAYCAEVCRPEAAQAAGDEILGSELFLGSGASDDHLLRTTRSVAARHVSRVKSPAGWRGVLAAEHESECDTTAARLAERANGELSAAQAHELDAHLAGCPDCRELQSRTARAEEAFNAALLTDTVWLAASPRSVTESQTATAEPPGSVAEPAWIPAAMSVGAAAGAAAATAAPEAASAEISPVVAEEPQSPARRRRGIAVLLAGLGLLAAVALGAVLLGGGSSKPSSTRAAAASSRPVTTTVPTHRPSRHAAHHARAATHRALVHHRRVKKHTAHASPSTQPPSINPAPTSVASAPAVVTPTVVPAPVVQPVPTPAPSSGAGGGGGAPSPGSVAVTSGNSLPADNAPTQGIGSGKGP